MEGINDAAAVRIRPTSLLKWGLFFLTIGLLGLILLLRSDFLSAIGVFFLLSALVGIAGLRYHQMIPLAIPLLGGGIVPTAVLLVAWPEHVFEKTLFMSCRSKSPSRLLQSILTVTA